MSRKTSTGYDCFAFVPPEPCGRQDVAPYFGRKSVGLGTDKEEHKEPSRCQGPALSVLHVLPTASSWEGLHSEKALRSRRTCRGRFQELPLEG